MCAGVQNESRPIERCQETSHAPPIEAEVTATTPHQTYQGTDAAGMPRGGNESALVDIGPRRASLIIPCGPFRPQGAHQLRGKPARFHAAALRRAVASPTLRRR